MSDSTEDGLGGGESRGGKRREGGRSAARLAPESTSGSWPPLGLRVLWPTTMAPWNASSSIQLRQATTDDSGPDDVDDDDDVTTQTTSTRVCLTAS